MHFDAHTKLDFDELLLFKKCEVYYYYYYGKQTQPPNQRCPAKFSNLFI